MVFVFFMVANVVAILVGTAMLCVGLLLVGNEGIDRDTILKSLGIVVLATLVTHIPYVGCLVPVAIWVVGIMVAFEKTFGEAILVAVVCWVLNLGVLMGLVVAVNAMFAATGS